MSDLTRVADFTPKMLGNPNDQRLKTKGAETWGVALFLLSELRERGHFLGADGDRLIHAGEMLNKIARTWKDNDWSIPRDAAKDTARADSKIRQAKIENAIGNFTQTRMAKQDY